MKSPVIPPDLLPRLKGKTVYCGFSGGPDSLALLLLLHEAEADSDFTLKAVHFEHGLRGRAGEEDAEFCRRFCGERGIPFACVSLHVPENRLDGESIETAARRLRLNYWKMLPKGTVVTLGHQSDDVAENLFLRLMRGANVSGLTSLSFLSEMDGILFFRPLIGFSREDILNLLRGRGLQWRTDATNLESEYGRNFLRNRIFPALYEKFPYARGGVARSIKNLTEDAEFIDTEAVKRFAAMNPSKRNDWISLPNALFCRVFRLFLEREAGTQIIAGHDLTERFREMIQNFPENNFSELQITGFPDFSLFIGNMDIVFVDRRIPDQVFWNYQEKSAIVWGKYRFQYDSRMGGQGDGIETTVFDSEDLPKTLLIRQVRPEDRMIPFGRKNEVAAAKLLSSGKVPAPLRFFCPAVCTPDGSILWIPGVRRSNRHPARENRPVCGFSFFRL